MNFHKVLNYFQKENVSWFTIVNTVTVIISWKGENGIIDWISNPFRENSWQAFTNNRQTRELLDILEIKDCKFLN